MNINPFQGKSLDYTIITQMMGTFLPSNAHCKLIIGLVRGIDMKEKLFYITTPEPIHRLEQVNCLMLGKNELPSSVYMCSKVSKTACLLC